MFSGYALTTGTLRTRDLGFVLGTETEPADEGSPRSRVFVRHRGQWIPPVDLDWNARSCTFVTRPDERLIAISEQGYVACLGGGEVAVEPRIAPGDQTPGPLIDVRAVATGSAYAVGTMRQAYVRERPGGWRRIDYSCRANGPGAADRAFCSVDGFTDTDIYAGGWEGEIWSYDGRDWSRRETPTNLALYSVRCAGDDQVYAVGQRGLILRGRGNRWESVEHQATEEDFWACEWFQDRLFVATTHSLYELRGSDLLPVDFGATRLPGTCYHLSAGDGAMWSIGALDLMQLDQDGWSRVI
jgi:hypothetical protein